MARRKKDICEWWESLDTTTQWTFRIILFGMIARFAITFFVHASGDSLGHLSTARYMAQTFSVPLFEPIYRPFFYYPPLFHFIAATIYFVFSGFGEAVATKAMNFIAPLFGSASLIVFYQFCKRVVSKKVTLYAVFFLSFIPLHMYYSTLAHVDIVLSFMVLCSLTLLYTKRFYGSAIINGLGMITKYTQLFFFPTLLVRIYQLFPKKNTWIKKSFLFFIVSFIVGIPLYLRNYIYLGTPLWPFMNSVFEKIGFEPLLANYVPRATFSHFLDYSLPLRAYLDTFGVPLGLPQNISFVPLPFFLIWLLGTLIFCIPFIRGIFSKKPKDLMTVLYTLMGGYALMILYFIYDYGDMYMRLLLPIFPAVAIIWAYGLQDTLKWFSSKKFPILLVWIALIGISVGFVGVEFAKAHIGAQHNAQYSADFEWIKQNVPDHAFFDFHSVYLIYHTGKQVVGQLENVEDVDPDLLYHFEYPLAKRGNEKDYSDWKIVYENPSSGVKVFKKT